MSQQAKTLIEAPDTTEIDTLSNDALTRAKALVIKTAEDYAVAVAWGKGLKALEDKIQNTYNGTESEPGPVVLARKAYESIRDVRDEHGVYCEFSDGVGHCRWYASTYSASSHMRSVAVNPGRRRRTVLHL